MKLYTVKFEVVSPGWVLDSNIMASLPLLKSILYFLIFIKGISNLAKDCPIFSTYILNFSISCTYLYLVSSALQLNEKDLCPI